MHKENYCLEDLLQIMSLLRSQEGCPWDREQTHESLKRYCIEETYEVLEAIDLKDKDKLCDELGDLLLQIVFHAQIAKEVGNFDMSEVVSGICRKMINRHTHVFGNETADTSDKVLENWEAIKKKEKGHMSQTSVLEDVPRNLPALMRSFKVQQKAAQVGFDWDNAEDVFNKLQEEIEEVKKEVKSGSNEKLELEMGDLLFTVTNLSRHLKVQPEIALTASTDKFIRRFEYIESEVLKEGKKLDEMTLSQLDQYWDRAKREKGL